MVRRVQKGRIVLLALILAFLWPFFSIRPVSAFSISYTPFWFYVGEPTTLTHPDMSFKVYNLDETPIRVTATLEIPEGLDINAQFEWDTKVLNASETSENAYSLSVSSSFSVTARIIIRVLQQPVNVSDSQIIASGTVVNYITFYSQSKGAIMKINIVDQGDRPRNSFVDIKYKYNDSFAWTPFLTFNDSSYEGAFPLGSYFIRAIDLESGRIGERQIELTENAEINVYIPLIRFRTFIIKIVGEEDEETKEIKIIKRIGLEAYIDNFVPIESGVEIYAELSLNGELLETTNKDYHQDFEPIIMYKLVLWFSERNYPSGTYAVTGYIFVGGVKAVEEIQFIPEYQAPVQPIQISLEQIALGVSILVILVLLFKPRRSTPEEQHKEGI